MTRPIRTDLGPVTAYAIAVAYGYEGTEAEFAQLQADSANNAQTAATAATNANASKNAAAASAAAAAASANSMHISDFNQLFALEESWEVKFESSDLVQGGYNSDGSINALGTNYLRPVEMIPIYKGMSMHFKGGTVIDRMKAGYFDPVTRRSDASKDVNWFTGEQTITFDMDGLIVPLFRRASNTEVVPSDFDAEFELISATKKKIDERLLYKHCGDSVSGLIDPVTTLECGYETQARKNLILGFRGDIPSNVLFDNLEIGLKSGNNYYNKVVITRTNNGIDVAFTVASGNTITESRELSVLNNIQVDIHTFVDNKVGMRITSNGNFVDLEFGSYQQWRGGKAYAKSSGTLNNCRLSWANADIAKRIWFFGDSYTAYASNRWPYYAGTWLGNILLDGYGGQASAQAITAFNGYLNCGIPEYAVFATGMNDGSDTNANTPNANWLTAVESFLNTCKEKEITPILCTIPTTSVFNNNAKNAYVRGSGCRYIDFARAVGADGSGDWYDGMLGEDNIHPTVAGAKALCAQIGIDLPEVFIDPSGVDKTLTVSNMAADAKTVGDALAGKVSAVSGKGLSTNDYTTAEKTKLDGIEVQATRVLIDDTLEQTGQAADAKAVGDALTDLADDIPAIDDTLSVTGAAADAKKTGDEISGLKGDLDEAPKILGSTDDEADLYICDARGNVIGEFVNGHIVTKDFNSSDAMSVVSDLHNNNPTTRDSAEQAVDLDITDTNGNALVRFANGEIQTKKFNSLLATNTIGSLEDSDLDIADDSGNVVLSINDGDIITKYFNSALASSLLTDFEYSLNNRLANPLYETREHYNEENPNAPIEVAEVLVRGHTGTTNAGYRIPTICVTNAGTILVAGTHMEHPDGDFGDFSIDINRKPSGEDWDGITTVVPFDSTREDYGSVLNDEFLVDRNTGRIYLFFGTEKQKVIFWDVTTEDGDCRYIYSDDDGITWSNPVSLKTLWDTETYDYCIPSCTKGITLTNGTLVVPCFCKKGDSSYAVSHPLLLIKPPQGDWYLSSVASADGVLHLDECAVVEGIKANEVWLYCRPNANYGVGAMRGYNKFVYNIATDKFTHIKCTFDGNRHNCFGIDRITISDKLIFLMTFTDTNTTRRENVTLWASLDGNTWIRVYRIHSPAGNGYSAIDNYNGLVAVAYEATTTNGSVIAAQDISPLPVLIYNSATMYIERNISIQDRMQMLFNAAKGL